MNTENDNKKNGNLPISNVSCSFRCKECRVGKLKYTGGALYSDPLQYEYICDECGRKVYLEEDKEDEILWL